MNFHGHTSGVPRGKLERLAFPIPDRIASLPPGAVEELKRAREDDYCLALLGRGVSDEAMSFQLAIFSVSTHAQREAMLTEELLTQEERDAAFRDGVARMRGTGKGTNGAPARLAHEVMQHRLQVLRTFNAR